MPPDQRSTVTLEDTRRVTNFFIWTHRFWGKKYFLRITDNDEVSVIPAPEDNPYGAFTESYQEWSKAVRTLREVTNFEYPVWALSRDYRDFQRSRMAVVAGMSVCVAMMLLYGVLSASAGKASIAGGTLMGLAATLLASVVLAVVFMKYPRKFCEISIDGHQLKANFVDGSIEQFSLRSVKRYSCDIRGRSSFIVFSAKSFFQ